jgi:mono/diheme cytochrome c family protein
MRRILVLVLALTCVAIVALAIARRPQLPPAERGRRLAEHVGCFGCHGPEGTRGTNNPGRTDRSVPNFADDVMMFAKTPQEIREWIRFGVTKKRQASLTWRAERARGALEMPPWKGRVSETGTEDLVAYVMAMAGMPEPDDSLARTGLRRAGDLGCTGCHGPGARLARPNPRAWKGCVPSWDGADFPELVRDSTEFREWAQRGRCRRFDRNLAARSFLHRENLKMPAFVRFLEPGDPAALWAYLRWLRSPAAHPELGPTPDDN